MDACAGAGGAVANTARRALRTDMEGALERLRAFQQAVLNGIVPIVQNVDELCRLAETCMTVMQTWELADQDGSMDPASRSALVRLMERGRGIATGAGLVDEDSYGAMMMTTGGVFADRAREAVAEGSSSGPINALRANLVYVDVAQQILAEGCVTDFPLADCIQTLLEGLGMMRTGLLRGERGVQAMLADVRETFGIVKAVVEYMGRAGHDEGVGGEESGDHGCDITDSVRVAGGGQPVVSEGQDVLEDMIHIYNLLHVVL
jgi:hypothetical protein